MRIREKRLELLLATAKTRDGPAAPEAATPRLDRAETGRTAEHALFEILCARHPDAGEGARSHRPFNCLIDAAAALRHMSAEDIRERIRQGRAAAARGDGRAAREPLRRAAQNAFVYFDRSDTARVQAGEWDADSPPKYKHDPLRVGTQYFYYYDQRHSRGTDLVLPPDAKAIITVDPFVSTVTEVAQSAFRMRNLDQNQRAYFFLIPPDAAIASGTELFDRLASNEGASQLRRALLHEVQCFNAARRIETRSAHRDAFEYNPDLAEVESRGFTLEKSTEPGQLMGRLASLASQLLCIQAPANFGQEIKLEQEQERKQEQQEVSVVRTPCIDSEVLLSASWSGVFDDQGVLDGRLYRSYRRNSRLAEHCRGMDIVLSPGFLVRPLPGTLRAYATHSSGKFVLMTLPETAAETAALTKVVSANNLILRLERLEGDHDPRHELLCRYLAGGALRLTDQARLLAYVHDRDPEFRGSFKGVVECFGRLGVLQENALVDRYKDERERLHAFVRALEKDARPLAELVFPGVRYELRGMASALKHLRLSLTTALGVKVPSAMPIRAGPSARTASRRERPAARAPSASSPAERTSPPRAPPVPTPSPPAPRTP